MDGRATARVSSVWALLQPGVVRRSLCAGHQGARKLAKMLKPLGNPPVRGDQRKKQNVSPRGVRRV